MKKILIKLGLLMMLCLILVGCDGIGGDKFAGTWIVEDKDEPNAFMILQLDKNDKNYLMDYKVYQIGDGVVGWMDGSMGINKINMEFKNRNKMPYEIMWMVVEVKSVASVGTDNVIHANANNQTFDITYIEKDNELQLTVQGKALPLKRFDGKDVEGLKKEKQEKYMQYLHEKYPNANIEFKAEEKHVN